MARQRMKRTKLARKAAYRKRRIAREKEMVATAKKKKKAS
jgi:hypothetical protein